jgi:hypothetical protein
LLLRIDPKIQTVVGAIPGEICEEFPGSQIAANDDASQEVVTVKRSVFIPKPRNGVASKQGKASWRQDPPFPLIHVPPELVSPGGTVSGMIIDDKDALVRSAILCDMAIQSRKKHMAAGAQWGSGFVWYLAREFTVLHRSLLSGTFGLARIFSGIAPQGCIAVRVAHSNEACNALGRSLGEHLSGIHRSK